MRNLKNKKTVIVIALLITLAWLVFYFYDIYFNHQLEYLSLTLKDMTYDALFFAGLFIITNIFLYTNMIILKKQLTKLCFGNVLPSKIFLFISLIFSIIFSLFTFKGIAKNFLLFQNAKWFGIADPVFNQDISYYVFKRPFFQDVYNIAFGFFILLLVITAVTYLIYFIRASRLQEFLKKHNVFLHLTIIISILFLIKALTFKFSAENMLYENHGSYVGLGYIENKIWIPYYSIAPYLLIAVLTGILLFGFFKKQKLAITFILIYPICFIAFNITSSIQKNLYVVPNEASIESPYIKTSMNWTKQAYGLDKMEVQEGNDFEYVAPNEPNEEENPNDFTNLHVGKVYATIHGCFPFLYIDDSEAQSIGSGKYIMYGYTSTDTYPLSATYSGSNYFRHSVIFVINSKNETVIAYIVDNNDPIISAYNTMYPNIFSTEKLPKEIQKYMRYPKYLFDVQTEVLQKYNTNNTLDFYQKDSRWEILREEGESYTITEGKNGGIENEATLIPIFSFYDDKNILTMYFTLPGKSNIIAMLQGMPDGKLLCTKKTTNAPSKPDTTPTITDLKLKKSIEEVTMSFNKYKENLKNGKWNLSGKSLEELEKKINNLEKYIGKDEEAFPPTVTPTPTLKMETIQ